MWQVARVKKTKNFEYKKDNRNSISRTFCVRQDSTFKGIVIHERKTNVPIYHSAARLHFIETVLQRLRSFTTIAEWDWKSSTSCSLPTAFYKKVTACCNWMRTLIVEEFMKEQSYCSNNSTTSLGLSVKWNLCISLPFYSDHDNFKSSNSILVT